VKRQREERRGDGARRIDETTSNKTTKKKMKSETRNELAIPFCDWRRGEW